MDSIVDISDPPNTDRADSNVDLELTSSFQKSWCSTSLAWQLDHSLIVNVTYIWVALYDYTKIIKNKEKGVNSNNTFATAKDVIEQALKIWKKNNLFKNHNTCTAFLTIFLDFFVNLIGC